MAKAAMDRMARYLACELRSLYGIHVNGVAHWFIATPLTTPILKGEFATAV